MIDAQWRNAVQQGFTTCLKKTAVNKLVIKISFKGFLWKEFTMILMAVENKTDEYETIYCSKKCAEQSGVDLKKHSLEQLSQREFDEINYPENSVDKGDHHETPEGEALPLFGHCCSNWGYCGEPISF